MKTTTLAVAAVMAAGTLAYSTLAQTTWTVCQDGSCDFETIQQAIDAAADGDTVEVGPGLYPEHVDFHSRELTLISQLGPDATVIRGPDGAATLRITQGQTPATQVIGFTLEEGTAMGTSCSQGGQLLHVSASPVFQQIRFVEPADTFGFYDGTDIGLHGGSPTFLDCWFIGANVSAGPNFITSLCGSSPTFNNCFATNVNRFLLQHLGGIAHLNHCSISARPGWGTPPSEGTYMFQSYWNTGIVADSCTFSFAQSDAYFAEVIAPFPTSVVVTNSVFNCITPDRLSTPGSDVPVNADSSNTFASECCDSPASCGDCDSNGISDADEIAAGAADLNANGIPDTCECIADLTGNGEVNGADISVLFGFWGKVPEPLPAADINQDGLVNGLDLGVLLGNWGPCQ